MEQERRKGVGKLGTLAGLHRDKKGQATVEFLMLTIPILVLLLIVVDFSLALRDWIMVANAVREGARYGALGGLTTEDQIVQRVVERADTVEINPSEVSVHCAPDCNRNSSVVVRVTHAYTFPLLRNVFPSLPSVNITTCSDMRLETGAVNLDGGGEPC